METPAGHRPPFDSDDGSASENELGIEVHRCFDRCVRFPIAPLIAREANPT